jgi:hypothetical protein
MKKTLRGTLSVAAASVGILATVALPAGAKTVAVDPILLNDTKLTNAASVTSAGATFDTPFLNAAYPVYSAELQGDRRCLRCRWFGCRSDCRQDQHR